MFQHIKTHLSRRQFRLLMLLLVVASEYSFLVVPGTFAAGVEQILASSSISTASNTDGWIVMSTAPQTPRTPRTPRTVTPSVTPTPVVQSQKQASNTDGWIGIVYKSNTSDKNNPKSTSQKKASSNVLPQSLNATPSVLSYYPYYIYPTTPISEIAYTISTSYPSGNPGKSVHSTTDVPEGTNLYYTDARVQFAMSGTMANTNTDTATLSGRITTNEANIYSASGRITTNTTDITNLSGTVLSNYNTLSGSLATKITLTDLSATGGLSYNSGSGLFSDLFTFSKGLTRIGNSIGISSITGAQLSGFTAGQLTFGSTASGLTQSSNLFWDNTNGRLGVGTNTPTQALDIRGRAIISSGNGNLQLYTDGSYNANIQNTNGGMIFNASSYLLNAAQTTIKGVGTTSATNALSVQDSASTSLFTVRNDGNVGIGTSTPAYKLEVTGNTNGLLMSAIHNLSTGSAAFVGNVLKFNNSNVFYFGTAGANASGYAGGANATQIWSMVNGPMLFAVNNSEKMRLTPNGNIGIGTTTPLRALHVVGATPVLSTINTYNGAIIENSDNVSLLLATGIAKEAVISFGDNSNNNIGQIAYDNTTDSMRFRVNDVDRVNINNAGNVGIGTNTPLAKLQVNDTNAFTANTDAFIVTLPNTPAAQNDFKVFKVRSDGSVKLSDRYGDTTDTGLHVNYLSKTNNVFFGRNFSNLASTGLGVSNNKTGTHNFAGSIQSGITAGTTNQNANEAAGLTSITSYESNNYTAAPAWTYGVYAISNNATTVTTNGGTKSYIGGYFSAQPNFSVSNANAISIGLQAKASGGQYNYAALFTEGLVGIGTIAPQNQLHIAGSTNTTYQQITSGVGIQSKIDGSGLITALNLSPADPTVGISSGANFGFNGSANNFYGMGLSSLRNARYDMWFQTGLQNGGGYRWYTEGTTERMTMLNNGRLGIGTIAPGAALEINSADAGQLRLRNTTSAAGKYWKVGPDNSNNAFTIFNQSTQGVYMADGGTSWISVSDERIKNILEPITNAVDKIGQLRTVIGTYKSDPRALRHPFFIAQDVQKVLPEAVNIQDDAIHTLGVSYTEIIPLLAAGINELSSSKASTGSVDALAIQISTLSGRLAIQTTPVNTVVNNYISSTSGSIFEMSGTGQAATDALTLVEAEAPRSALSYITDMFTYAFEVVRDFVALEITAIRGYFDQIFARTTHTEILCIGTAGNETCITKAQLDALLAGTTQSHAPSPDPIVPPSSASGSGSGSDPSTSSDSSSSGSSTPPATNPVLGCMDSTASNYSATATQDDGSCIAPVVVPDPITSPDPTTGTGS